MRYDAFISYRHTEKDMFVAKKVHKQLETYKVPKRIQKSCGKTKIARVFRDQEELPIGSDLGNNIESALAESEYLIVICSPNTKESEWVMKEIDTFISMHGREKVLAVLVEGEPGDSFPAQLLVDDQGNPVEPLAADVRGVDKKEISKKIKTESLRLLASILGCAYDDLKQRHKERQMKKVVATMSAVMVLAIAFGIYNAYNLQLIHKNYEASRINQSKYLADVSLDLLEKGDRQTAALLAREALPSQGNRPFVPEAMYALNAAMGSYSQGQNLMHDKVLTHNLVVSDYVMTADGANVISWDQENNIYYWDIESGEIIFQKTPDYHGENAEKVLGAGEKDGNIAVLISYGLKIYDKQGNVVSACEAEEEFTAGCVSTSGDKAAGVRAGMLCLYDVASGELTDTFTRTDELHYGGEIVFSEDSRYVAVCQSSLNAQDQDYLTVIDTQNKTTVDIAMDGDYTQDIHFTADGKVAVAAVDEAVLFAQKDGDIYLQKCDYNSGLVDWKVSVPYNKAGFSMAYTHINSREWELADGSKASEIYMSVGQKLYSFDLATGREVALIQTDSSIEFFRIALNTSLGYIATLYGDVVIADLHTGEVYPENTIEVSDSLLHFSLRSGVLVARTYSSPNLIVMTFVQDESMQEITAYEDWVSDIVASPAEKTVCVSVDMDDETMLHFLKADTLEEMATAYMEGSMTIAPIFMDEKRVLAATNEGKCYVYNIDGTLEDEIELTDESGYRNYYISPNGECLIAYGQGEHEIISVKDAKVIASSEDSGLYGRLRVDNRGENIYYAEYNTLYRLDASSLKEQTYEVSGKINTYCVSPDGKRIAMLCGDGALRVLDAASGQILLEETLYSSTMSFVEYADDRYVLVQGADKQLRLFDTKTGECVYVSRDSLDTIYSIQRCEDEQMLCIVTGFEMIFFDMEHLGMLGEAMHGVLYLGDQSRVICTYNDELYAYDYHSLKDLLAKFDDRYGHTSLTTLQKLQYFIE